MKCDKLKAYGMADPSIDDEYKMYKVAEVDEAVTELKAKLANKDAEIKKLKAIRKVHVKAIVSMGAGLQQDGKEISRLKHALWLARAELCHRLDIDRYLRNHRNSWYNENCLTWDEACVAMEVKMCKAENKCRAKSEEYR